MFTQASMKEPMSLAKPSASLAASRLRIVVDVDGNELDVTQIKGSTGTNDDVCTAVLADWGIN